MSNPLIKHKTQKYQDGKPIKKYYPPFTKEQKAWMDKMAKMSGRTDITDSPIDWFLGFSLAKPFLSLGKSMAQNADDAIKFVSLYPKAMGYGIAAMPIIKKTVDLIAPPESNPKIEENKQQKAWNDAMNYKTNTFVKYQKGSKIKELSGPTIYSRNDPAFKAYQDSLQLYNLSHFGYPKEMTSSGITLFKNNKDRDAELADFRASGWGDDEMFTGLLS